MDCTFVRFNGGVWMYVGLKQKASTTSLNPFFLVLLAHTWLLTNWFLLLEGAAGILAERDKGSCPWLIYTHVELHQRQQVPQHLLTHSSDTKNVIQTAKMNMTD